MDLSPSAKDLQLAFSAEEQATVSRVLKTRRTINTFTGELPDEALLLDAFEHARWAPNHKLTEPWQFILIGEQTKPALIEHMHAVMTEEKGAEKADKKIEKLRAVPGYFAVTSKLSPDDSFREREDYAATCCAIQIAMTRLWSLGIASKWSTAKFTRHENLYKLLEVNPAKREIVGLFMYGYPDRYPRTKRQAPESVVKRV
ncbi:MAG: nitroreductase family protein [Bacteroidota bacterium]